MHKIIFMGTPDFSVEVLEGLVNDANLEVVGVVTQPDRPVGRKKVLKPTPVKELALKHDIPVYQPEKIRGSQEAEELKTETKKNAAIGITTAASTVKEPLGKVHKDVS